ncbi:MAG: uracil-DNA glycosylase family protein [Rubrobacteraceae bacterium]
MPESTVEGDSLEVIATEVTRCQRCELWRTRTKPVPGSGSSEAEVIFVGEGPGWHEDQQGLPFVGASGKFLDELLGISGLSRGDVFITNIVKNRPPGNRDPLPDEIAACNGYLDRQIAVIKPALVVTLGRYSMGKWFPGDRISKIHGQPRRFGSFTVVPMYHPAAGLRAPAVRERIETDFAKLPSVLDKARRERAELARVDEPATLALDQMQLF